MALEPGAEAARRLAPAVGLLNALSKHGVTNALLDHVSNRYRYRRDHDETWPTSPPPPRTRSCVTKMVAVNITKGGFGYSSPPVATVPGHPEVKLQAGLAFSKDLEKNGSAVSLTLVTENPNTRRDQPPPKRSSAQ